MIQGGDLRRGVAVAGLALATSIAGVANRLVQDDVVLILQNPTLHSLANWREIFTSSLWPPPWDQDLYRPLTSLLLAAQFELGGGSPVVFRIVSYLLYAAAAAGVFFLALRLLPRPVAWGAGFLFAVHPVHVEAVALGVGQSELLVGLLAVLMTSRYLDRRRLGGLRPRDWALLGALYLAASLIKEQGILLPGFLLAAEMVLPPEPGPARARRLIGGYGFLAGVAGLVVLLRVGLLGGPFAGNYIAEALEGLGPGERALTMLTVVPRWARLLLWPAHLQADYSPQEIVPAAGFGMAEVLGLFILIGTAAAAWLARRKIPVFSFGAAWLAIGLLPVSNVLIPTGIMLAERTLFLPSVGVVLAGGGLASWLLAPASVSASGEGRRSWIQVALAAGCVLLIVAGVVRSARRHQVWRSDAVLAERTAEDAPRSYRIQTAYGYSLFEAGFRERAIEAYQRAIALAPPGHVARVRNDLARRFFSEGNYQAALAELERSRAAEPDRVETWNYLILSHLALGAYRKAAWLSDSALARGGSPEIFGDLRAVADSAERVRAPPGSIRIRVLPGPPPR